MVVMLLQEVNLFYLLARLAADVPFVLLIDWTKDQTHCFGFTLVRSIYIYVEGLRNAQVSFTEDYIS